MTSKPSVTIPTSELEDQLSRAAQIKAEMTELLRKLEDQIKGRPIAKPGGWRQDPIAWSKEP